MVYPHEDSIKEKLDLLIEEIDGTVGLMLAASNEHPILGDSGAILTGQVERLRELAREIPTE